MKRDFTEDELKQFRKLPDEYSVDGIKYKLFKRGNKGVIYKSVGEANDYYEVFVIKVVKPTILTTSGKETFVPKREKTPSNEDFGTTAWNAPNGKRALEILDEIESGIRPQQKSE